MDLLMKMSSKRAKNSARILTLAVLLSAALPVHGYAPTLLLGIYGQEIFTEDLGRRTAVRAKGLLSWRTLPAENASLALYACSLVDGIPADGGWLYDSHSLSLDLLLRGAAGRFALEGGLAGSVEGTWEGQDPYVRPDWRFGYEHGGESAATSLAYSGYYLHQPGASEDALFQALSFGVARYPSIRLRYALELLGGWERWTEQHRDDFLGSLETSAGGLIGYFHDWSIAARGGVRLSDDESESNLFLGLDGDWAWSPHRQVSIETGVFLREEVYFQTGGLADGPRAFSAGFELRGDWTPNDRLYLVVELTASRRFAGDPADSWWNALARAGLELSF